jgi:hypothetical protein
VCASASCTDDASCGSGNFCSTISYVFNATCGLVQEMFACQSAADQCEIDSDCAPGADGGPGGCYFNPQTSTRQCQGPLAQCEQGRPFLVDAEARVAGVRASGDWREKSVTPSLLSLSGDARAALAMHWTRVAQMEHASIAAFARFALELMALGAPASLLEETHRAMADETAHARTAFSLASSYAGRDIGPGELAIDGALGAISLRRVFATLAREGCIGETIAAIEATHAAAAATDVVVRDILRGIARDETNHAALAWRAAAWMMSKGDDEFRAWAEQELTRAAQERSHSHAPAETPEDRDLIGHGLLSESSRRELACASLRDVVMPFAQTLMA